MSDVGKLEGRKFTLKIHLDRSLLRRRSCSGRRETWHDYLRGPSRSITKETWKCRTRMEALAIPLWRSWRVMRKSLKSAFSSTNYNLRTANISQLPSLKFHMNTFFSDWAMKRSLQGNSTKQSLTTITLLNMTPVTQFITQIEGSFLSIMERRIKLPVLALFYHPIMCKENFFLQHQLHKVNSSTSATAHASPLCKTGN